MSCEDRLTQIKEQTRLRVKKHYEANKDEINRLRREKRKAMKEAMKEAPAPASAPAPAPASAPAEEPKKRMRVRRPRLAQPIMTFERAEEIIAESPAIESDESRKLYRHHLKTVKEILQCADIITCFQDAPKVIQALNDAKQKRDPSKGYSINSKKAYVQMVLKLSDVLSIPLSKETKEQYKDAFEALKLESKAETKTRQEEAKESKEPLTFTEYLPKVKERYGEDSKEFIIASLYSLHGFRDDLQLRIVREFDDKPDNQYRIFKVVNRKPVPSAIRLHRYKTDKAYGTKEIPIPKDLMILISRYTTKHKLNVGDHLFGDKPLSAFVSRMNKDIGIPLTINGLRELHVSPVIDGMSSTERVELAKKLGHSPATSEHYRAKKKA